MIDSSPESDVVNSPMPIGITLNDQQFSNKIDYLYYEFPSIFMLDPNRGPDTGGTHVLLKGNQFDPFIDNHLKNYNDTFCRFGSLGLIPAQVINSTKVVCVSPPSFVLREVIVEITLNNQEWTRDGVIFYYYHPPFVFDVDPRMGPVAGGTEVHVHGSNFEDTGKIRCKFGDVIVPGAYININELLCVSPKTDKPGIVPLQVAVHEDDYSSPDVVQFLYYDVPQIHYIDPICGPERGYTQIHIHGQNFIDPGFDMVYCVFNHTIFMNATVLEPNEIRCSSPRVLNRFGVNEKNIHFYDVEITLNRKDMSGPAKRFYYYREASIKSIVPSGGPIEGDTLVKITGKGFKPECACNVTVRFGTFQVRPINFTSDTIYVKSPNVSIGDEVVVSYGINGQQYNPDIKLSYKDIENTFTYYSNPFITNYDPHAGPSVGGTEISINGFGFLPFHDENGNTKKSPVYARLKKYQGTEVTNATEAFFVDYNTIKWKTPPGKEDSHWILELSLNGIDFMPVIPLNASYSFTYYAHPTIRALYPPYGAAKSKKEVMLFIKGTNFRSFDRFKRKVECRFGKDIEAVITDGVLISETEIHCPVPKFNKPDVVVVEISINEGEFTSDGKEYGFYDPYVWKVTPKMVSKKGNTTILIYGYGFVNTTGYYLQARFGYASKRLICNGEVCDAMATYIDKNHISAQTYAYKDIFYEEGRQPIGDAEFPVEASVFGDAFTENNVTIFYFKEPIYGEPRPNRVAANGNETIIIPANFLTKENNPDNPQIVENEELIFRKYSNITCRFTSITGKVVITQGQILHYPVRESDSFNTITCMSPEWELRVGVDEEQVILDISVNGVDYSGEKIITITERLEIFRIYPPCGPTHGNTPMTLVGTGFRKYTEMHLKWGVLSSIFVDTQRTQSFIYVKEAVYSQNIYENEVIGQNEETKYLYKEKAKYERIYSVSPKLPNWDRTHGGLTYISLGKSSELQVMQSKHFLIQNYGPSFMEYFYYKQPKMKNMFPHAGSTAGNTAVVIRGAWFRYLPQYGVMPYAKFGDKIIKCECDSTVRIVCRTPPSKNTDTEMAVSVSLNGVDFTEDSFYYHYYEPPIITDIMPKSGPESGGTRVRLIGTRFTNLSAGSEFMCRFTALSHKTPPKFIPAVYENETSIICRSPGGWGSGSKVGVEVTFNGEEYTTSGSVFYFYSVKDAQPRSGPSDGTAGILTVSGSGFRESSNVFCAFDGIKYKAVEVAWSWIKCKIPKAKQGDDFFGEASLEVSLNGVDLHRFEGGFQYYPQINVTDLYPRTGPAKGKGLVKFYGNKIRADFSFVKPMCKFGKYIGVAEILNEHEILCHIPDIDIINQTYRGEVALNGYSFVSTPSGIQFTPYGIYDIDPNSGPMGATSDIMVYGEGFIRGGKARCRYGISGSYLINEGTVLSNQKMICPPPTGFEFPSILELPVSVPFSISFFEEKINPWTGARYVTKGGASLPNSGEASFDPWTETGHTYLFYNQPIIARISPNIAKVREILDVYVYANPNSKFIERNILYCLIY